MDDNKVWKYERIINIILMVFFVISCLFEWLSGNSLIWHVLFCWTSLHEKWKMPLLFSATAIKEVIKALGPPDDQNPDAESSDILWFVSSQDDFYEDAAPREEHGIQNI